MKTTRETLFIIIYGIQIIRELRISVLTKKALKLFDKNINTNIINYRSDVKGYFITAAVIAVLKHQRR